MRTTIIAMILLLGLTASVGYAAKAIVSEDKPTAEFITAVEQKLTDLEMRIKDIKADTDKKPADADAIIKASVEMSEEKIETIRNTQIPALKKAMNDDAAKMLKKDINRSLKEATEEVNKAEKTLRKAKTDRQKYAADVRKKLDGLKKELADAQEKSKTLPDADKAMAKAATESAEEAIQETGAALDRYNKAPDEKQADNIKDEIEKLLDEARNKIDEACDICNKSSKK